MNKKRKKIALITNWYPTNTNPYQGIFFKEQAFALEEKFDFCVIHITECKRYLLIQYFIAWLRKKHIQIERINEERNTVEYNVTLYYTIYILIADVLKNVYEKYIKRTIIEGVGRYVSLRYIKNKKKKLKKIFTEMLLEDIDILYAISAQTESSTLQCLSEILEKPYMVAEHGPFPWPGSVLSDAERNAIINADLFLAISYDKIRQVMMQNIQLKRIKYVGNMVDETQFYIKKQKREIPTFIIVAAHSFYKNYPLFIRIFETLTEITAEKFEVMIVGYGANKGYSKNVEKFEERICNSKFRDKAVLIPEVAHDKMNDIYNNADVFVMTSIQEGMPVSALEAACCGLPIFTTMCGGVEDYIDDNIGRVYNIIDYEAFANGLKDYLEKKIVFDSEYIRKYIISKYGKDIFAKNMTEAIESILEKKGE